METKEMIRQGKTALGIELGSTRIKIVLIDDNFQTIASGSYEWENQLINGIWTYSIEQIWQGVQESYLSMVLQIKEEYGLDLEAVGSLGFSGMMHGYLAFNQQGELLVPFRTWRNAITADAEERLTDLFQHNIPQRWSIAHLYQAILNEETHVKEVAFLTTLSGYVHWQLTGEKVLGVGDASGMFPINKLEKNYDSQMLAQFQELVSSQNLPWKLEDLLPRILLAGEQAGVLTEAGARLLDPSGHLNAGILVCPPEGDAGTGMVATNSIAERTGNVSVGTSVFAMVVLEKPLARIHREIDLVTTPTGNLVGMVHANNGTSEINAWLNLFQEFTTLIGAEVSIDVLFTKLFTVALTGDSECGGMLSYGYYSGENITQIAEGRPLFLRSPTSNFTLANFMRLQLFSIFGGMKLGMNSLRNEQVEIDRIVGHGGFFKTPQVGQQVLAAVMATPVTVMETAGEGGAWGIAVLASYLINQREGETLETYLTEKVFVNNLGITVTPTNEAIQGFDTFVERYQKGLKIEQSAIDNLV